MSYFWFSTTRPLNMRSTYILRKEIIPWQKVVSQILHSNWRDCQPCEIAVANVPNRRNRVISRSQKVFCSLSKDHTLVTKHTWKLKRNSKLIKNKKRRRKDRRNKKKKTKLNWIKTFHLRKIVSSNLKVPCLRLSKISWMDWKPLFLWKNELSRPMP